MRPSPWTKDPTDHGLLRTKGPDKDPTEASAHNGCEQICQFVFDFLNIACISGPHGPGLRFADLPTWQVLLWQFVQTPTDWACTDFPVDRLGLRPSLRTQTWPSAKALRAQTSTDLAFGQVRGLRTPCPCPVHIRSTDLVLALMLH